MHNDQQMWDEFSEQARIRYGLSADCDFGPVPVPPGPTEADRLAEQVIRATVAQWRDRVACLVLRGLVL